MDHHTILIIIIIGAALTIVSWVLLLVHVSKSYRRVDKAVREDLQTDREKKQGAG